MTVGIIILSFSVCLILVWSLSPIFQENSHFSPITSNTSSLLETKTKLLEEFRDLEFDHQLNKMSYDDYQEQRKIVLQDLKTVYEKLDEQSKSST